MEHVIHEDANQPQVGDKPQGKDDSVTISKAELEGLHRTLRETQQSERDWAAMARREPQPEPAGEPEEEIDASQFVDPDAPTGIVDGDTPEKLVDDLAAQGVAALSKRGYVTAAQAQQIAVDVASKVSRASMRPGSADPGNGKSLAPVPFSFGNAEEMLFGPDAYKYKKPLEVMTTLFAGTPPSHVAPKKPEKESQSIWDQIRTGKTAAPTPRTPKTPNPVRDLQREQRKLLHP